MLVLVTFLLSTLLSVFTAQTAVSVQVSPVKSQDIRTAICFLEDGITADVYGNTQNITVVFSEDWIKDFRKKRAKELDLIKKEKDSLIQMRSNPCYCRTEEQHNNIELFIRYCEQSIHQREEEERLDNNQFFALYDAALPQLRDDILATRARLSGIKY